MFQIARIKPSFCTPRIARLLIMAGATLPPVIAAADVTDYAAVRYVGYTQTSDAAPTAPESFLFQAVIISDTPGELQTSRVSYNAPAPTEYVLIEALTNFFYFNSPYYTDEGAFLIDFPATVYTLNVDRGFGPETGDVYLPADLYCPEIPAFTGDTFTRLQGCNPSLAFDGTINGFTLAPGTNSGSTNVTLVQAGRGAVWGINLDPGETTFQIPAGLMLPATEYSIGITYVNEVVTPNAGFFNATSLAEFFRGTGMYFATTSSCDHFAENIVVGGLCTGNGQDCENTFDGSVETCGLLMVEYIASPNHCSQVGIRISVDGALTAITPPVDPGQSTALFDLGPVSPGEHTFSLEAYGVLGGCNVGALGQWAGTLRVHRCADATGLIGPDSATICPVQTAAFSVAASGHGPFAYQWEVQFPAGPGIWIPLFDGDVAGVGTVSGATAQTLMISAPAESGPVFHCIVTNACSAATSAEATLTLEDCAPPCPADFNMDGGVDGSDIQAFFEKWEAGDFAADVNSDGGVDGADVDTFFAAWEAGGC